MGIGRFDQQRLQETVALLTDTIWSASDAMPAEPLTAETIRRAMALLDREESP